ncbi:MAG: hypothetical protein JNM93_13065 [Bacteriovoracaceae bacterium]|nr:hypothetical protein [Bacteriovoracaceae bacterium]
MKKLLDIIYNFTSVEYILLLVLTVFLTLQLKSCLLENDNPLDGAYDYPTTETNQQHYQQQFTPEK